MQFEKNFSTVTGKGTTQNAVKAHEEMSAFSPNKTWQAVDQDTFASSDSIDQVVLGGVGVSNSITNIAGFHISSLQLGYCDVITIHTVALAR